MISRVPPQADDIMYEIQTTCPNMMLAVKKDVKPIISVFINVSWMKFGIILVLSSLRCCTADFPSDMIAQKMFKFSIWMYIGKGMMPLSAQFHVQWQSSECYFSYFDPILIYCSFDHVLLSSIVDRV